MRAREQINHLAYFFAPHEMSPQVANSMQIFSPCDGPQRDCEPRMYVWVLTGVPCGLQELADFWPGKHKRALGSRKPRAQRTQPWANRPLTPFKCLEGNVLKGDGFHPRMTPAFNSLPESTSKSVFSFHVEHN